MHINYQCLDILFIRDSIKPFIRLSDFDEVVDRYDLLPDSVTFFINLLKTTIYDF